MKIIVCVKQVPGTQAVLIDPQTHSLVREGVEAVINAYDMYAVEEALRLRENHGGVVTALSMGIPKAADSLRHVIAMGVDEAVLLSEKTFAGADTLATAYALSRGIRTIGEFDLILCGKQSSDGDTGQTAPSLAEKLGLPHVTQVRKIRKVEPSHLVVERVTDEGYDVIRVKLPAVLSVVKELNKPRMASMKGRLKASGYKPLIWDAAAIGAEPELCGRAGSPTWVERTFAPKRVNLVEMLSGSNEEKVSALVDKIASMIRPKAEVNHNEYSRR